MTKREYIKAELESITLRYTATVAGHAVTRWPAGYEIDTIDGRTPARTLEEAVAVLAA